MSPENTPGISTAPAAEANETDERGHALFRPGDAFDLLYAGVDIGAVRFAGTDPAMEEHDRWCDAFDKPRAGAPEPTEDVEAERLRRTSAWRTPEPYASLDLRAVLAELCRDDADRARVEEEMTLFEERGLVPLLRAALFVAETARTTPGVVLGVGRGSSVSSHCLFLLGVHRVDSLKHGLDIREFVR